MHYVLTVTITGIIIIVIVGIVIINDLYLRDALEFMNHITYMILFKPTAVL